MAEQTTNPNRPPLFKVTRGATLKGSQVELLGTPDDKPLDALKPDDRVWVREFLYSRTRSRFRHYARRTSNGGTSSGFGAGHVS